MFIHFLCLCPLILVIMLNFNISKVAYYIVIILTRGGGLHKERFLSI